MATLKIEYYSEVLAMNRTVNVLYPDKSKVADFTGQDIPVLYLLHGMSGNENSWLNRSGIDRLVRNTNLAVVMPSTDLGFYTNTKYGMNYLDAILEELPEVIHDFLPQLSTKREKTFIAGLSMGGYGAFRLAMASDKFSYAASLSGAISFRGFSQADMEAFGAMTYWEGLFGSMEEFEQSDNNLFNLAEKQVLKPKLYAWCGKQDSLFEANNYAMLEFEKAGYEIIYESSDGSHEWYYWTKMIDRVLDWLPIDYQREERLI